ncbi:hypothetical protein [Bosea sp. (in: a-proteobacteria)]|uniref:hypothetical protein n=1 Tax=Bosea sp. (in: a-proteobacteria) TaxID=1871050 RepID=UPI002FC7AAA5
MKVLIWIVSVPLLLTFGWGWFVQPSYEHRFRIAVAIATPDGVKEGSSVWSVTCTEPVPIAGASVMTGGCKTVGEAIFVDLGQGRNLIALMARGQFGGGVDVYDIAARAFDYAGLPRSRDGRPIFSRWWYSYAPAWQGRRELRGNNMLTLASFASLEEPASGRVVQPTPAGFETVLGAGYQLERITLEMVPAGIWPFNITGLSGTPVSKGIEQRIPLLISHRKQLRNVISNMPPRYQAEFSQFLRGGDFAFWPKDLDARDKSGPSN